MAFIHSYLSRLGFSLRRNVIDYCNILLLFFFNREKYYFLMNVYLDNHHSAAKFMLDQVINIPNLLYIGENFNIRDTKQNLFVFAYSAAGQTLMDLTDSLGLMCSLPVLLVPTYYLDTDSHANSVIDLIFLGMSIFQVSHCIEPNLKLLLDYTPLLVNLFISPENICFNKKVSYSQLYFYQRVQTTLFLYRVYTVSVWPLPGGNMLTYLC